MRMPSRITHPQTASPFNRSRMGKQQERELEAQLQKVILERVAAEERASAAEERLAALEAARVKPTSARPPVDPTQAIVEQMLQRIEGLRELLATASIELSQLHADEVALAKKRTRVLSDACALLARAVGATGQAPPPIPSAALAQARLTMAPVVDISEVANLIESLRPPRAPKVDSDRIETWVTSSRVQGSWRSRWVVSRPSSLRCPSHVVTTRAAR